MDTSGIGLSAHTSFAEAEISFKKELPGLWKIVWFYILLSDVLNLYNMII